MRADEGTPGASKAFAARSERHQIGRPPSICLHRITTMPSQWALQASSVVSRLRGSLGDGEGVLGGIELVVVGVIGRIWYCK
jgi:hypothetical protein